MENLNTARESALEALGTGASDEAKNAVNNRYDQLIQKTRARLAEDLSRTGGLAGILRRNPKKAAAAGLAGTAVTAAALGPGGRPVAMPTQSPEEAGAMAALEEMTAAHARPGDMYPGAPTLNQVSGGFTIPASAVGEYAPSRHAIGQQPHMS